VPRRGGGVTEFELHRGEEVVRRGGRGDTLNEDRNHTRKTNTLTSAMITKNSKRKGSDTKKAML